MSHFSVAVFTKPNGKSLEELLAPYSENLDVESYIYKTRDDIIQEGLKYKDNIKAGKTQISKYNKDIFNANDIDALFKAVCEYYEYEPDENGNVWSTYNPDSKWDWYSIGGRFPGKLKSNNGQHGEGSAFHANPMIDGEFDSARIRDIDFSMDMEAYNEAIRYWEVAVDKQPLKDGEDPDDFINYYRDGYFEEYYKDKETYAKIMSSFTTFAVVTVDGKWHEKGEMLYFGMSTETADESLDWDLHYKERFIDTADPDWTLTIVDCHI